jgi:hypothetical protein
MLPVEEIALRKEIARLQCIADQQAQRIENVAVKYKAMFGMDEVFRKLFPERVMLKDACCQTNQTKKRVTVSPPCGKIV